MSEIDSKGKASPIQRDIVKTANELFEISMLDTKSLKIFLYNLLLFDEIRQKLKEILDPFCNIFESDWGDYRPSGKINRILCDEIIRYFGDKDIILEQDLLLTKLPDFINPKSEKSIGKRYQRIMRAVTHLFNTPLTSIAITLTVDKDTLDRILGDRVSGFGEPLIKPNSWRDRILKIINYYLTSHKLGTQQRCLLNFFKGYIKLTNIIEILNKDTISSEERQYLVKNIGEPMIEITGGLVNYRDTRSKSSENLNLTEVIVELKEIIFNLLSQLGKEPSASKGTIFTYNMLYSMASLLAVGADIESLKYVDEENAKKAEKLRIKLSKLLIEKYKIEAEENKDTEIYEGEITWRDILINRELCKEQASVLTLLGVPVKNSSDPIKYEKFML